MTAHSIQQITPIGPVMMAPVIAREFAAADKAQTMVRLCQEKGLIILACGGYGNVIRISAPFVITDEQLEKGFGILEEALAAPRGA